MMRRLSFKLPIVLRYCTIYVALFGLIHTIAAKDWRFSPYLFTSPLLAVVLCQEEIKWWMEGSRKAAS